MGRRSISIIARREARGGGMVYLIAEVESRLSGGGIRRIVQAGAGEAAGIISGSGAAEARVILDLPEIVFRDVAFDFRIPGDPRETVAFEIEPTLPYPLDEAVLSVSKIDKYSYLVAAVRREDLDEALAPVKEAGIPLLFASPFIAAAFAGTRRSRSTSGVFMANGEAFILEKGRPVAWTRLPKGADPEEILAGLAERLGRQIPDHRISPDNPVPEGSPDSVTASEIAAFLAHPAFSFMADASRESTPLRRYAPAGLITAVAAGLLIFSFFGRLHSLRSGEEVYSRRIDETYTDLFPGGRAVAPREQIGRRIGELEERGAILTDFAVKESSALSVLDAVSSSVSSDLDLRISDIMINEEEIRITGSVSESAASAAVRSALLETGLFSSVEDPDVRESGAGLGYEFTITGRRT